MNEQVDSDQTKVGDDQPARSGARRPVVGRVVSDKMDKTITVLVERRVRHPLYKKFVRLSTKFHAHDEENEGKLGDKVSIEPCRPISKTKSWRLATIVDRAK